MADHQDHTSMYCHACHRTWERDGSSIECPQCSSSSTEMITPEHDPRLFHNRHQGEPVTDAMDTTATPMDTTSAPLDTTPSTPNPPQTTTEQGQQPSRPQDSDGAATPNGNINDTNRPQVPQPIRFTAVSFPGGVTLFTTVVGDQPPPQFMPGPVPIPFLGWQFMQQTRHTHSPAEANHTSQEQPEGHQPDTQQQQETQQPQLQEQPAGPQPAPADAQPPRQAQMIEAILAMLFNPAAAIMGDAVYSQEAYDRVMTMLRNQAPVGGAPPASQAAIEKLVVKELDEAMLGGDGTSKCVVCVEDMVKGEKATVLPCSHFFHGECVTPWLKEHNTCPVCRRSIEQEDPVKNKAVVFGPEMPPTMRPHEHQDNGMDCS